MKKFVALILMVLLSISAAPGAFAQEEANIKILCLGKYLEPDVAPFYADSRIMAPVRAVFEAVGAEVVWDDTLKKATGTKEGREVCLTLGSNILTANGEEVIMDTVLTEKDNRVFAPIRFVAESFGYKVSYHDDSRTAVISSGRQYEFYSPLDVALPRFDSVTGAEFIRQDADKNGYDVYYYTYNEDHTTDYFNSLQADFGYELSNIYFENGAHIYEYSAGAGNHTVSVADYYNSDGVICITVTPGSKQISPPEDSGKSRNDAVVPQTPAPGAQLPQTPDTEITPGSNPLDYSAVTGMPLIEQHTMDNGTVICRYAYNQFAHMAYESFLASKGWRFSDFDFDLDTFANTTYYSNGTELMSVSLAYMYGEVWIIYP